MTSRPPLLATVPARSARPALTLIALASGFVMAMLDVTVANGALSTIRQQLGASPTSVVWVADAYTLTFAALLLLGGAVGNHIGAKNAYLLGLAWFVIASAACASAPNVQTLIAARLLQGVGAALFMPNLYSLLTEAFPDKLVQTRWLGIWAAIVGAITGSSPFISGLLVTVGGWRSIFYVNVPMGAAAMLLTWLRIAPSRRRRGRMEVTTHGVIMLFLAALGFVLIQGPSFGWSDPRITAATAAGVFFAIIVAARQMLGVRPVVPLPLATNRMFWSHNLIGFLMNFVIFGNLFLLSLYLQDARGSSPLKNGAELLPLMAVVSMMNFVSGPLSVRFGRGAVLLTGVAAAVAGCLVVTCLGAGATFWQIVLPATFCNAGLGLAIPAMISGVMQEAGASEANLASTTLNASRQIGAFVGVAMMGIVLHGVTPWTIRLRYGFVLFAGCLIVALVSGWLLQRSHARLRIPRCGDFPDCRR